MSELFEALISVAMLIFVTNTCMAICDIPKQLKRIADHLELEECDCEEAK